MVVVSVTNAPVWHMGDIVATVTGDVYAAYLGSCEAPPVVLLDSGELQVLASFHIEAERAPDRRRKMRELRFSTGPFRRARF